MPYCWYNTGGIINELVFQSHLKQRAEKKADLKMFAVTELLQAQSEGPSIGHVGSLHATSVI